MSENLHHRLSSDFTLFNLNDPKTTKFYVKHIDYFVSNFPYFKDIELLTDYILSRNIKFTKKFLTRLKDFQEIIKYSEKTIEEEKKDEREDESSISCLYPTEESEVSEDESSGSCDSSESERIVQGNQNFPNHVPIGHDFTVNKEELVFRCYSKVIRAFYSSCTFTPHYMCSLAMRSDSPSISSLIETLIQDPAVLRSLVKSNGISLIASKNIRTLGLVIEGGLGQVKSTIEDEEELLDQVEMEISNLLKRFLAVGLAFGYIAPVSSLSSELLERVSDISLGKEGGATTQKKAHDSDLCRDKRDIQYIYNTLLAVYSNRSPSFLCKHTIKVVNRYTLYYIRLLSYTSSLEDENLGRELLKLLIEHRQNTHLQISLMRIYLKVSPEYLDATSFIDAMCDCLYGYVAASKSFSGRVSYRFSTTVLRELLGHEVVWDATDSLFSFLIRLYMRYSTYISSKKPYAEHIQELMKPLCMAERIKYQDVDTTVLAEWSGFERYIAELIAETLPRATSFEEDVTSL